MATANENALGTVALAGDLAGGSDATNPQLTPTGAVPGDYKGASVVVDSKGRVVFARDLSGLDIPCASGTSAGIAKVGRNITATTTAEGWTQLSLIKATKQDYGVVRLGQGFERGCCETYVTFPAATATSRGIVSVPEAGNVKVQQDGSVSLVLASADQAGIGYAVDDNGGNLVLVDGTLSFDSVNPTYPTATTTKNGMVTVPTNQGLSIADGIVKFDSTGTTFKTVTATTPGLAQVGSGFEVTNGVLSVPVATKLKAGVARGDSSFTNTAGKLSWQYIASTTQSGLVKVGAGLGVNATTGVLSRGADGGDATTTSKGLVAVPGAGGLSISAGLVSTVTGSADVKGMIRGDATFTHTDGTLDVSVVASANQSGLVQIGANSNLAITADGTLSYTPGFTKATADVAGIATAGTGMSISADGTLSVNQTVAGPSTLGLIKLGTGFDRSYNDSLIAVLAGSGTNWDATGIVSSGSSAVAITNGMMSLNVTGVAGLDTANAFFARSTYNFRDVPVTSGGTTVAFDLSISNNYRIPNLPSGTTTFGTPLNIINGTIYRFAIGHASARTLTFSSAWKLPGAATTYTTVNVNTFTTITAVAIDSVLYCLSFV